MYLSLSLYIYIYIYILRCTSTSPSSECDFATLLGLIISDNFNLGLLWVIRKYTVPYPASLARSHFVSTIHFSVLDL